VDSTVIQYSKSTHDDHVNSKGIEVHGEDDHGRVKDDIVAKCLHRMDIHIIKGPVVEKGMSRKGEARE